MDGVAVIIETRRLDNIAEVVRNHMKYSGMPVYFFHGADNKDFVQMSLNGEVEKFINMGITELTSSGYNRLLTSSWFWSQLPEEKVLVFQHDSWMLREGIEEFMEYDFIGSNIYHIPGCFNGGFSLRSKSKSIELIEKMPYISYNDGGLMGCNEDIYFSHYFREMGAKLPTHEVASKFCVETVAAIGSMAVHNIQRYLCKEICDTILNQYSK